MGGKKSEQLRSVVLGAQVEVAGGGAVDAVEVTVDGRTAPLGIAQALAVWVEVEEADAATDPAALAGLRGVSRAAAATGTGPRRAA